MESDYKYIKEIKSTAENAKKIYSEKTEALLKNKIVSLKDKLESCVDKHAGEEEFDLIISNDSSSDIKLYEVVYRVKSPDSLEEKIIRNQEFFDLFDKSGDDLNKELIKANNDLMGIRFLVSLSCDCEKLYNLLLKYENQLKYENIEFIDIKDNPQIMKNGRSIYRIKGLFEKYPFELQIKSKVDSAWADVEHMLFYKDYQFSYIQSTNKQVMTKLGDLLDQVDELMVQVRESQSSYKQEKAEMEFTQYLGSRFRDQITAEVGSAFVLSEFRKVLFSVFNQFTRSEKELILENDKKYIGHEFVSLGTVECPNSFLDNYNMLKSRSLEFVISEHIYTLWLNDIKQLEDSHTNEALEKYFSLLIAEIIREKIDYYSKKIDFDQNYIGWLSDSIVSTLEDNTINFSFPIFINNAEKLFMLYAFYDAKKATDINYTYPDEMTDEEINEMIIEPINKVAINVIEYMFNSEIDDQSNEMVDIIQEFELISDYYGPEFVAKMSNSYKAIEKTSSGKAMPENQVVRLFNNIISLCAGE